MCLFMSGQRMPVGVVVDISTIEEITAIIEDHGLARYIRESDDDELLDCASALNGYGGLKGSERVQPGARADQSAQFSKG